MNPALQYAEQTLGVHVCHDNAQAAWSELDGVVTDLDKAQDRKRALTEQVADREADLLIEEQGKHASMSATALKEHMKVVVRKDDILRNLRAELNKAAAEVSGLEYDVDTLKLRIKIECARMEELGGYLRYLAAIKEAETLTKLKKQENA